MGRERVSSLPTKISDVITIPPNFNQFYGESLKDAWVRINKINGKNSNSCEKENCAFTSIMVWCRGIKMP
jgi:hypothetical protein